MQALARRIDPEAARIAAACYDLTAPRRPVTLADTPSPKTPLDDLRGNLVRDLACKSLDSFCTESEFCAAYDAADLALSRAGWFAGAA